jgi:hypothetical protein
MRSFIFILATALLFSCGQSSKIPDDYDYGKTENGVYTNNYFGIEVTIPDYWIVQSKEQVDQLIGKGVKFLEENKEVASHVKKNREKTVILLAVFKYPMDSVNNGYNPFIMILAEKLTSLSGIKTGIDYLENEKEFIKQAKIGYNVISDYSARTMGGKEFDVLRFTKAIGEQMDVKRVYHVRIEKEYALNVLVSFAFEKQEKELMDVLEKIKFD